MSQHSKLMLGHKTKLKAEKLCRNTENLYRDTIKSSKMETLSRQSFKSSKKETLSRQSFFFFFFVATYHSSLKIARH